MNQSRLSRIVSMPEPYASANQSADSTTSSPRPRISPPNTAPHFSSGAGRSSTVVVAVAIDHRPPPSVTPSTAFGYAGDVRVHVGERHAVLGRRGVPQLVDLPLTLDARPAHPRHDLLVAAPPGLRPQDVGRGADRRELQDSTSSSSRPPPVRHGCARRGPAGPARSPPGSTRSSPRRRCPRRRRRRASHRSRRR